MKLREYIQSKKKVIQEILDFFNNSNFSNVDWYIERGESDTGESYEFLIYPKEEDSDGFFEGNELIILLSMFHKQRFTIFLHLNDTINHPKEQPKLIVTVGIDLERDFDDWKTSGGRGRKRHKDLDKSW
jgi:hypothetical protein